MTLLTRYYYTFVLPTVIIYHLVGFCFAGVLAPKVKETIHCQKQDIPELFDSLEESARLVDISYCIETTGIQKPFECLSHCNEFKGFELVTTWNTGPLLSDSCGYIALSHAPFPKRIILAFRGTYSIVNALVDLSLYPQAYVPYKGDPDENGAERPPAWCLNCTVHAGFMNSWRNARPEILRHVSTAREQYPDYNLVVIGHSLGGAVAALAGTEMQLRGWGPQITTFGEPRVGNEAFVRFIDRLFGLDNSHNQRLLLDGSKDHTQSKFLRVTHINDPVPLLPFEEWGYRMHAGEIFISKPNLPFSTSDIEICDGDQDPRCIAGKDEALSLMLNELNGNPYLTWNPQSGEQVVLSTENNPNDKQPELGPQWSLIPSKYRLWELLFAHRDYFWRIGLCVPGGDPTGPGV